MHDSTKTDIIAAANYEKMYDDSAKRVFANKEVVIPILERVVPEFSGLSQEEIFNCFISGPEFREINVSDIPDDLRIRMDDSEQSSLLDKLIRYDTFYRMRNPKLSTKEILVNIHINLENQLDYHPSCSDGKSYPVVTRAVYYAARGISKQLGTITDETNYGKLEKVYSIWICSNNIPKKLQNAISSYSLTKQDIFGTTEERKSDYDLMTIVMVRRGNKIDSAEMPGDLFQYLDSIFDGDIETAEEFSEINWSETLQEEVGNMASFSSILKEKAEAEGRSKGRAEGKAEGEFLIKKRWASSLRKLGFKNPQIAEQMDESEENVRKYLDE